MKTLQEQIEMMQHFANGGEVEYFDKKWKEWTIASTPNFNWAKIDYRIKEQKKTITIEKWLITTSLNQHLIAEAEKQFFVTAPHKQIKLLETYEVEL